MNYRTWNKSVSAQGLGLNISKPIDTDARFHGTTNRECRWTEWSV